MRAFSSALTDYKNTTYDEHLSELAHGVGCPHGHLGASESVCKAFADAALPT
jgi:hypothetical protein